LTAVARGRGKTITDLALAWVLRRKTMTGAIVGIRNPQEAREMTGALDWNLEASEVLAITAALARTSL
jgi:L-glyceraldehyde 3-phosphate reductase